VEGFKLGQFFTVEVATCFALMPPGTAGRSYQTKDLPSDGDLAWEEFGCGEIRDDGLFLRDDQKWNSTLCGWARLRTELAVRASTGLRRGEFVVWVRFERGRAVQVARDEGSVLVRTLAESLPDHWRR